MKVTKEILENKKVKLEIHVDPQEFEKGMEKSYLKNRKSITVPGFRKGKVPRKIIERYYGEAVFYEDAINGIIPDTYDEAVKETGIEPVGMPEFDIVQVGSGQELILSAEVDVKPEVELGQYQGIEVVKAEYTVSDHDVDHQLEHKLEDNARWVDVEGRGVENGDRVLLDYAGAIDGKEFAGGKAENHSLDIGSGQFIPGFEEQLIGMNPEEEKDITVTFPEDYQAEDLKGKEAVFHVKIQEIKKKELPMLDDEFAKDVSEFESLDEYKADIRQKLQKQGDENARNTMENQLVQKITDNARVDIPEIMVESEIDNMVHDMEYQLQYNGLTLEDYLKITNTSAGDFRAQYKESAYNRVKVRLVMDAITKAEGITVTEEDLEKEYRELAEQYKEDVEEIKKRFSASKEYIENSILIRKTTDKLMAEAVLTEAPPEQEQQEDREQQDNREEQADREPGESDGLQQESVGEDAGKEPVGEEE